MCVFRLHLKPHSSTVRPFCVTGFLTPTTPLGLSSFTPLITRLPVFLRIACAHFHDARVVARKWKQSAISGKSNGGPSDHLTLSSVAHLLGASV